MKVAVVGSRGLVVDNLVQYLPKETSEIISGGAKGIDTCAEEYAKKNNIKLIVIKPDYQRYKKGAPLIRNKEIVDLADCVIAFWDKKSRGTKFVIDDCLKKDKKCIVYNI